MGSCLVTGAVLVGLLAAGCRKSPSAEEDQQPAEEPSAPAPPAPRCPEVKEAGSFLIGEPGPSSESADDDVALPFAAELGSGVGYGEGFAVTALRARGGGTAAVVALVAPDVSRGRLVDLGPVHGGGPPPLIASFGDRLLVVVADSDAGGRRLRLATLSGTASRGDVRWGAELAQGRSDSERFGLAVGAERGVLVWDEWDSRAGRGVVRLSTFALADIARATPARNVSPEASDVEGVQVARRPGGYWLAWVSHSSYGADAGVAHPAPPPAPSVGSAQPDEVEDLPPVLDLGRRWLEVVPVGEDGSAGAPPLVVTPQDAHVVVFDLASGPDGSAWLTWRDDRTSPGAEKRSVNMARVRPDGAKELHVIQDERFGAGAASILVDSAPPAAGPVAWLALDGINDQMRIGALDERAVLVDALAPEAAIGRAEPVAVHGGTLLLARPRGTAVELSAVACRAGLTLQAEVAAGGPSASAPERELPPFEDPDSEP